MFTKKLFTLYITLAFKALIITTNLWALSNSDDENGVTLFPANNETNVNPDTRLVITFPNTVILGNSGKIRVYDASTDEMVDSLDMSIPPGPRNTRTPSPYDTITFSGVPDVTYTVYEPDTDTTHVYQINYIGGNTDADAYHFFPVLLNNNVATICLHNNHLTYNKTYYIQIDPEVFPLPDGGFSGIIGKTDWTFSTKSSVPSADSSWFVVSTDGTGDFNTVQGAMDFIPEGNASRKTIFIKNGIYEEIVYFRNKENVTLLGEDREKVVIRYANNGVFNYKNLSPEPGTALHNIRAVFAVHQSKDVNLINFTILSMGESPAQAEGLLTKGERIQVHNITIIGSGDALQATGKIFISESSLKGFGDNVLGYGAVFFYRCDLISTYGPHLWVRNTDANHGNVFLDCKLWTEGDIETDIARAPTNHGIDYPYAEAVLLNCSLEGVRARGWGDVGPERENIHYWEYNSTNLSDGTPVDVSQRASYSRQLTMEDDSLIIANYSNPTYVLDGWSPEQTPIIFSHSDTITVNKGEQVEIEVGVAAAPIPVYKWYKNGEVLIGQTSAILCIDSASIDDEGDYSVRIENYLGNDSCFVATLLVDTTYSPPVVDYFKSPTNSMMNVFPNPAENILYIEYVNDLPGSFHGSIVDITGKEVASFEDHNYIAGNNISTVDVSLLKTGIYFIIIENSKKKIQSKLSIIR